MATSLFLLVLLAPALLAHGRVCDPSLKDSSCDAGGDEVSMLQVSIDQAQRFSIPKWKPETGFHGAGQMPSYRARPPLEYFRFWAQGKVQSRLDREVVLQAHQGTKVALVEGEGHITTASAEALLVAHRAEKCPQAAGKPAASWSLHDRAVDAGAVQHVLLRSSAGRLQYLAVHSGLILAADPPACPSALLEQDPELPSEEAPTLAGEPEMLVPETDQLAKDCTHLFHRTAEDLCGKDFDIEVISANTKIIDGFAVEMVVRLTGDGGQSTLHHPTCNFEVSLDHTDASLLEQPEHVAQDEPDTVEALDPLAEEKNGLKATLAMDSDLCLADQESDSFFGGEALLRQSMGELSRYKGYEHVNDALPRIEVLLETDTPSDFDMRERFPSCFPLQDGSEVIRNQGTCGSCWAFATASATMNNLCASKSASRSLAHANDRLEVSVQQILSCNDDRRGCEGGWATSANKAMMANEGISRERDFPYMCGGGDPHNHFQESSASCEDYPWGSTCKSGEVFPGWKWGGISIVNGEDSMVSLISQGNSLYVTFDVYSDFMRWTSGIYGRGGEGRGHKEGGHAVVAMGYGTEGYTKYWLLQNSWGPQGWGIGGFGKFLRGRNLCGIEDAAYYIRAWVSGGEVPPCVDGTTSGLFLSGGREVSCAEASQYGWCDDYDTAKVNCPVSCSSCPALGPEYSSTQTSSGCTCRSIGGSSCASESNGFCCNADNDPNGDWCFIEPGCASVSRNWDYCQAPGPTVSHRGCTCRSSRFSTCASESNGFCCNSDNDPNGDWCFIEPGCASVSGNWDYC